jgi:hypothetical protein
MRAIGNRILSRFGSFDASLFKTLYMKRLFAPVLHALLLSALCSVSFGQPAQNAAPQNPQVQQNSQPKQDTAPPTSGTSASNQAAEQKKPTKDPLSDAEMSTKSVVKPDNWQCMLYATYFNIWRLEVIITPLSTYHLQNCSPTGMDKLSVASAVAQLRTVASFDSIIKGGAHQQIMSVNLTPVSSEYYLVSNLKFAPMGSSRISLLTLLKATKLTGVANLTGSNYRSFPLEGRFYYIWNIGTLVHRLVSPEGDTYIMTSYTTEVSPSLTRANLVDLASQLDLPAGWLYESYFLDKTITVRSGPANNNTITTLFDDLHNNYVKYND